MSGSHDGEQPPRSPRRPGFASHITDQLQKPSIRTTTPRPAAYYFDGMQVMPCPEHNCYSNKQSAKVNAGLEFGGSNKETKDEGETTLIAPALNSNTPAVDVDFTQFSIPTPTSLARISTVGQHIRTLLSPPPYAFLHGVLSIQWAIGALGQSHFHFRTSDERYILTPHSEVRTQGTRLGLPGVLMDWLCGDVEEASPTEEGMLLTREFFEWFRREWDDRAGE